MKQNQKEVLSLWSAFNSTDLILKIKTQIWEKIFYIKGQSGEEGIMMARLISSQIEQELHFFPASGEKEAEWTWLRFAMDCLWEKAWGPWLGSEVWSGGGWLKRGPPNKSSKPWILDQKDYWNTGWELVNLTAESAVPHEWQNKCQSGWAGG